MNKLTMKATKRILCLLLCLLCLLAAVPLSAIAEGEESLTHIDTCVEGCTGEDCTCTCHAAAEPAAHIETCVEGCTGENCACTCHAAAEPAAHIDTCVEGCTGEDCTCTCHVATVSEQDNKDDQNTGGDTASIFNRLMNCTACSDMAAILDSATNEEMYSLDTEDLNLIIAHAESLEDDGQQDYVVTELTIFRDNEAADLWGDPGGGSGWNPGGGTQNELNLSMYKSSAVAYWDTTTGTSSATGSQDERITNITLKGIAVRWGDSGDGQQSGGGGWGGSSYDPASGTGGTALGSYFPNGSTSKEVTSTLSITPAAGYYVTKVVVACLDPSSSSPYGCNTWSADNAFEANFNVGTSGTVEIDVTNKDFSHSSSSDNYYILIQLAPIPSPLYVEYWPGEITKYVDSSVTIFDDSDGWTNQDNGNVLGTAGQVHTDYTQFMYKYSNNSSEAANWKHYANSITDAAKTAAANAGYYFTGWKIEYYTKCTTLSSGTGDRNYAYTFSTSYGTGTAQPGDDVRLTTNCKIIAQWAPIELVLKKTVSGLEEDFITDHSYTIQVQKLNTETNEWEDFKDVQTLTVNGNSSATVTLSPITPGTYRAVEVEESRGNLTKDGKTMYITVTDSGEVTYGATPGATSQTLTVTNAYTATAPAYDLTIKKTVSGNMYSDTKQFAFTVSYTDKDGNSQTATLNLAKDGQGTVSDIKVGTTVTVVENPEGYDYSFTSISPTTNTSDVNDEEKGTKGISFTMPAQDTTVVFNNENNANIDTGVILDALPYVLILAIVAGGVVLMLLRRRRSYED